MQRKHFSTIATSVVRLVLALFIIGSATSAQNFQTTIVGQVTDSTGAVVVGAKVTITAQGTGRQATATTSNDGSFVIPQLPAGLYDLQVEATGFRRAVQTGLTLETGQTKRVNVPLEAGAVSESVSITSEAPPINTDTSSKRERPS